MPIASETRRAGPYACDGVVQDFPFGFKVFSPSDVLVVRYVVATGVETVLTLNSDYTVALNEDQDETPGGVVALGTALAEGNLITLGSRVPNAQPTELTNQGGFYPSVITDALDRLTILVQQVDEKANRAIKIPLSTSTGQDYEVTVSSPDAAAAAAASAAAAAASAAQAQAAAGTTLNVSAAGASKFPRSNASGTAWEYLTTAQAQAALSVPTEVASQSEMETGTSTTVKLMTPALVAAAVAALAPTPAAGGTSNTSVPTGTVLAFAGASASPPTGFLFCNGANVSRTTYSELFAVLGTTWGAGDGSTTFTLPSLARRTLVGAGGTGTDTLGSAVGNTGGAETHTLTTAQMPAHTHGNVVASTGGSLCIQSCTSLLSGSGVNPSGTTASAGGGAAHNIMQPSAVVRFIIKT